MDKNNFTIKQIGVVRADEMGFRMELLPPYKEALTGLEGFSHLNILWWFSGCDKETERCLLTEAKPYSKGPDILGVFATRSPNRPNPIALSCANVINWDLKNGIIWLAYMDADDLSPVLDIKPYTPSLDRVEAPAVPDWCKHWPGSVEASGAFDWETEFNF